MLTCHETFAIEPLNDKWDCCKQTNYKPTAINMRKKFLTVYYRFKLSLAKCISRSPVRLIAIQAIKLWIGLKRWKLVKSNVLCSPRNCKRELNRETFKISVFL